MAKTDLQRLPLDAQLAAVKRYHQAKMKCARGSAGFEDPYITVRDIRRKFRCICPEGLLRAYVARHRNRDSNASRALAACVLLPLPLEES